MNYPNKIQKQKKKIISYGNRGMNLEEIINRTNEYYLDCNRALIYKKPTPIGINKITHNRITDAYFKAPSTLDYNGLYRGRYIEFEAKETKNKQNFPLKNIPPHQIKQLARIQQHGGIGFIIILMNDNIYLLNGPDLMEVINQNKTHHISYDYLQMKGYLLHENYLKGLNYLDIIDQIYKGELK